MDLHRVLYLFCLFPQQRKLMGSSAQNNSGVYWCRRLVRFNEVPEKVPAKVPGGFGAGARSISTRFRRRETLVQAPGQVQQGSREGSGEGSGRLWWVRFNKVPEKVLEKVPEKVSEKVSERLGAEVGQV